MNSTLFVRKLLAARWTIQLLILSLLLSSSYSLAQTNIAQIKSFGNPVLSTGNEPFSRVIEGSDNLLYGTTFQGGAKNKGVIYRASKDGSGYLVIHNFAGAAANDGRGPVGELTEGSDGALYGTTLFGGTNDSGCIFKMNKDGSAFTLLKNLSGTDGVQPHGGVLEGSDGNLYCATYTGGANNFGGTIVRISKTGTGFTVLKNFLSSDGANSYGGLIEGLDGALYGTTASSGSGGNGAAFKMNKDGSGFTVLHSFLGSAGEAKSPHARMVQSASGVLYGTTQYGGPAAPYPDSFGLGTIFKMNANGSGYQILYQFPAGGLSGKQPWCSLTLSSDGTTLYGQTFLGGASGKGVVFKAKTDGSSYTTLQSFTSGVSASETTGLLLASDGLLYGAKFDGGASASGFLYRIATTGTGFTVLHDFVSAGGGDGAYPQASLFHDGNGVFYGTTVNGGATDEGSLFQINEDGTGYAVLRQFTSANSGGYYPVAGVLKANDGLLYGAAQYGGSGSGGLVFKISATGTGFTVIHEFSGGTTDGYGPVTDLIQGPDGALYGVTPSGGSRSQGTIYRLTRDGTVFSILHSFTGGTTDGSNPQSKLVLGKDGLLYGSTREGGAGSAGTLFKINPNGTGFSLLRSFLSGQDGALPQSELIQGSDNNLYGVTAHGGPADAGTVFKINTAGAGYATLYSFLGNNGDGSQPQAGLIQATNGFLYGSTAYGGYTADAGTLFKINTDGSQYTQLYRFTGTGQDGGNPVSALARGKTDALYGSIQSGGQMGFGNLFKLFTPMLRFTGIKKDVTGWILDFAEGAPSVQYNIQASSNLGDPNSWLSIGLQSPQADGTFQFTDSAAGGPAIRFYRTTTVLPR